MRVGFDRTRWAAGVLTTVALFALVGMALLFSLQSVPVWRQEEGGGFLLGKLWFYRNEDFGMASMLYGTLVVSLVAMLIAVPVGIGAAVFSSEFLPTKARFVLKSVVELLAGVPSVVYGLLGVLLLRRWVYEGLELRTGDTLLTAGVLLGIMVLPTVMTLCDDSMQAVPDRFRRASRGLGLNRFETAYHAVLPQAKAGMFAAVLLGFGRAIGETIAVFLVVGRQDNRLPEMWHGLDALLSPGQTITSKLGGSELNIAYGDSVHWGAMMGLAFVLMMISAVVTIVGRRLISGT